MRNFFHHLRNFLSARAYQPAHFRVCLRDYFDLRASVPGLQPNAVHAAAAMSWLCRAQDATPDGGVSARYRFDCGWMPSYPETTGYIIPTFFHYAQFTQKEEYRARALRMSEWLLTLQLENGAFPGHDVSKQPQPVVFNTGQILHGLLSAWHETHQEKYLQAGMRAGDWLVTVQARDGSWPRFEYLQRAHAYHTRVAWSLLELWLATEAKEYKAAALRNLNWALTQQLANGWFRENGFSDNERPYLHTIAYALRGLVAAVEILHAAEPADAVPSKYFAATERASQALLHRFEIRRFPAAQYDREWKSEGHVSCLTGNAQIAVTWLLLYRMGGDARYVNAALKMSDFVKSTQDLSSPHPGIRGGIKGSHPVWGKYIRYSYPNWAAKFFVDALLLEEEIMAEIEAGIASRAVSQASTAKTYEPGFAL